MMPTLSLSHAHLQDTSDEICCNVPWRIFLHVCWQSLTGTQACDVAAQPWKRVKGDACNLQSPTGQASSRHALPPTRHGIIGASWACRCPLWRWWTVNTVLRKKNPWNQRHEPYELKQSLKSSWGDRKRIKLFLVNNAGGHFGHHSLSM